MHCPTCSNRFVKILMEKIGGWKADGSESRLSTWECPICKRVIAEKM